MATEMMKNMYLVNAPAGSGKTTTIRKMVEKHLYEHPDDNILCITYTNRAAEELGKNIDSNNVYFGTIHSYINNFLKSYFSHKKIIDFYIEEYEEAIAARIENSEHKSHIDESNKRYIDKYGTLSVEEVKKNIESIYYTETKYNSLYKGGLGHDDLLTFTRKVTERFPVIKKKIADKYQVVFIDEYQDTNTDVLRIFYEAMKDSSGVMYLLGDKMQQIYDNYDGSFEDEFSLMQPLNLDTNYRATPKLISILNNIYNDDRYAQKPFDGNSDSMMDYSPEVILSSNVDKDIRCIQKKYPDILILYLLNKRRFEDIGAGNLYSAVSKIDEYKSGGKYNVVDVLTTNDESNPDSLFLILFLISIVSELFCSGKYGKLLRFIKKNKKIFNSNRCNIIHHEDKEIVNKYFERVIELYNADTTIRDLLLEIEKLNYINEELMSEVLNDSKYKEVFDVPSREFRAVCDFLHVNNISTQHGVKGESHDSVLFVVDDSRHIHVSSKEFFKLWSKYIITPSDLETFNYDYNNMINKIECVAGAKVDSKLYKEKRSEFEAIITDFEKRNKDNVIFIALCKKYWDAYSAKPIFSSFDKLNKKFRIKSVLTAYKLFYVGCSRARKNLTILIDKKEVEDFSSKLKTKLEEVGFKVKGE